MATPLRATCPKCGRLLEQSGELTIDEATLPVFQCDECLVRQPFGGETFEVALTFVLDAEGNALDANGNVIKID